ncbi:MAG TPA: SLBB domain-containing protein, partial [Candidatus Dormibacteraeota bacterium]|nr:SLBB domain-containing protein [Candidatus Dormibacteraeota bacterium]
MTPEPTPSGGAKPGAAAEPAGALPRLLAGVRPGGAPMDLPSHLARHGPLPVRGRHDPTLIEVLERSGLCGRGGAAFPTHRKLAGVAARRGPAVVVANGTEGEPASAKDRRLLTAVPHLVLDGAALAARAVRAPEVIVAVHPAAAAAVTAAVAEREAARLDRVRFRVVVPPERFVTGEATALVHWLNAGVATPTMRPPHVFERGVDHRPTLVDNVETLAHIALIGRHGAAWFRALGTAEDPGSSLVTVSGPVGRPGVYEISRGMTVREVLQAARGATEPLQALLLGGYFGTWLPAGEAMELRLCQEGLRPAGASLGAGVLMALGVGSCGLAATARLASYLAE